ncbi:conserved hypothetical protein [Vibrio phage 424E50-1]|nr:conserved hypothetical protein [Vibrio phage 424E50-1]
MKRSLDFIGTRFKTLKGAEVTVVARSNLGNKTMYLMVCSICSKDTELFPYGSLIQTKDHIIKGSFNYGCCTPRRNQSQYKVLVKRLCKENDYSFFRLVRRF